MFAIYYILNNRLEIVHCNTFEDTQIMKTKLLSQGATIKFIRNPNGDPITNI